MLSFAKSIWYNLPITQIERMFYLMPNVQFTQSLEAANIANVLLSTSDIIQLIGIMVSLLTSIIAIIISIVTVRQNSKILEEANRPVISVYGQSINSGVPMFYLVVKNFGTSSAYMTKFATDFDLSKCYTSNASRNYIEDLGKCVIAPGQSRICLLDYKKIDTPIHFSLEYKSISKTYCEELDIDLKSAVSLPVSKYATKDKELLSISYSLQELLTKNL